MQLESFTVKNFRSIKDTKCYLSPEITVLAGKNESGKTTILKALEMLNEDSEFRNTDKSLNIEDNGKFFLQCLFRINDDEKQSCLTRIGETIETSSNEVIIDKSSESKTYGIKGSFVEEIKNKIIESHLEKIKFANQQIMEINTMLKGANIQIQISHIVENYPSDKDIVTVLQTLQAIATFVTTPPHPQMATIVPRVQECVKTIAPIQEVAKKINALDYEIIDQIPRVVLFSSFDDILPSEIPYPEFVIESALKSKHKIVYDLITLSKLDLAEFARTDKQGRANLTNRASKVTSDSFGKFWNQEPIEISFRTDEPSVLFSVQNKGKETLYRPDQRSKGLQWFMSFFLRVTAEGSQNNLILIDEPGLYLHAKAQQDVLELLEEISKNNQVVFTTHSPYLIDANKLGRIRLITRNKSENTEIQNNFNKGADIETLTPIITAIGLDITKGLAFSNKLNIIIEGVSDYYYLQAMLQYLQKKEKFKFSPDTVFIPCVGSTKVGSVISLLQGYGFDYKVLLDNKGTTKTKNSLLRDGVEEERIISAGIVESDSIENLFDKSDLQKYDLINEESSKTLTSKKFYDSVISGKYADFSKQTIDNFRSLMNKLKGEVNLKK